MGKLLIVNGSPRAPRSNSKQYAALFRGFWHGQADEYSVTEKRHEAVCRTLAEYDDILLVFPLYADGLPVTLMHFLKEMQQNVPARKPTVHVLINCGFLEPEQNRTAVEMVRLFCRRCGLPFGMALCIGSGEAILKTPFAFLARRGIKRLARGIGQGRSKTLEVAMPLTPRMFVGAADKYWMKLGAKNGLDREQMATMAVEGRLPEN